MTDLPATSAAQEWRQGWRIVLAGALGMGLASVGVYALGVFMAPLEEEFGWSRASISFGLTLSSFVSVLLSPVIGIVVDRWGPRRIAVLGVLTYCASVAAMGLTGGSIWTWWGLWIVYTFAASFIKPVVWTSGVSSMFNSARGLAISAMLCGTALGSSLTPLVSNWLIDAYGWRTAFACLALFWAVLVFPPVFFFFSSAKDRHRVAPPSDTKLAAMSGLEWREGMLSWTFAKLAGAAFLTSLVLVSFTSNIVPILSSGGLSRGQAAGIAGLAGIATAVGRLTGGYLLDRLNGSLIGGFSVALPIVPALLLLAFPGDPTVAVVAVLVLGLSLGVELDAVAYLSSRHFGMRSFGVLFGTIAGLLALATGVGPFFVSLTYDLARSYDLALMAYIPLSLAGSALFFSLGRYPTFDAPEEGEAAA